MVRLSRLPLLALLLPLAAVAQNADDTSLPEAPDAVYAKETHIDFEGQTVTAGVVGPNQVFTIERVPSKFNPLISVRRDFNDQMRMIDDEVR